MSDYTDRQSAALVKLEAATAIMDSFVNGAADAQVQTDSGNAPSILGLVAQLAAQFMATLGTYADVASGLAAVDDGKFFQVAAPSDDAYSALYRRVDGEAVHIADYPSAGGVHDLQVHVDDAGLLPKQATVDGFKVLDEARQVALYIDSEGALHARLSSDTQQRIGQAGFPTLTIGTGLLQAADGSVLLKDSVGQIAWRVSPTGEFDCVPSDFTRTQLGLPRAGQPVAPYVGAADINHVLVYGQSLSVGVLGTPLLSVTASSGALMPDAGVFDGVIDSGSSLAGPPVQSASFVPLAYHAGDAKLEAPTFGLGNQLALMSPDYQIVVSNAGHTSYAIAQLDKQGTDGTPTPNYQLAVAQCLHYKALANGLGKSGHTQFMAWIQGETDERTHTGEYYTARLGQLLDDLRADTGEAMRCVTYQTSSHTVQAPNHSPDVALAQWQLTKSRPADFFMCGPTYIFDYQPTDGEHLTGHGYRQLGCYFGKAIDAIIRTGAWRPLEPEKVSRQGRVVVVDLHVPVGPLVFDSDIVSDPGHYGFAVLDADGSTLTISSVEAKNSHVTILLDADPTGSITVTYALGADLIGQPAGRTTGARGCLRDSDDTVAYAAGADGNPYPLYNWCVMFSMEET